MSQEKRLETRLRYLSVACFAMTAVISIFSFWMWGAGSKIITSALPFYTSIAPVVSFSLLVLSCSFLFCTGRAGDPAGRRAAGASAVFVIGICAAALIGFITGEVAEWDAVISNPAGSFFSPGLMPPLTALSLLYAAMGVLCLVLSMRREKYYREAAVFFALAMIFTGLLLLFAYQFGPPWLDGGVPTSLPTVVVLVILGFGLLTAVGPEALPIKLFTGPSLRSSLNRVFVPLIVAVIFLNDLLQYRLAQRLFLFNRGITDFCLALVSAIIAVAIIAKLIKSFGDKNEQMHEKLLKKEAALAESNKRFALAAEGANAGIFDWDITRGRFCLSLRAYMLLGYEPPTSTPEPEMWLPLAFPGDPDSPSEQELRYDELVSDHVAGITYSWPALRYLVHPEDQDRMRTLMRRHFAERLPYEANFRVRVKGGAYKWVAVRGQAEWDKAGRPLRMAGSFIDITERKQTEEGLRHSEYILRLIVENVEEIFWVIEAKTRKVIYVSSNYEKLWEETWIKSDDHIQYYLSRVHPEDRALVASAINDEIDEVHSIEHRIIRKDGICRWIEGRKFSVRDAPGGKKYYVIVAKDVTEQVKMRDQILYAKQEWEATFDTINDAITIHDNDFNIILANKAAMELLGISFSEMKTKKCFEFYHGCSAAPSGCPSCEALKKGLIGKQTLFEPYLQKYLEIKALPRFDKEKRVIGLVHIVRDVSDQVLADERQQALQHQFLHMQKMDSIGRLAGGVAHDFNNILSGILGISNLIIMGPPQEKQLTDQIKLIKKLGEKAVVLTRQLLAFSRKQLLQMEEVSLNDIVVDMMKMLQRIIGEEVTFDLHMAERIKTVWADRGQMEQVLLNLAVNARDAMPQGGELTITTNNVSLSQDDVQLLGVRPGEYVLLTVSDKGCGMSEELLDKIFEPFFTTKEVGKGTGLGLATVYGIIVQHKGAITASSKLKEGTSFKIYLPAVGMEA